MSTGNESNSWEIICFSDPVSRKSVSGFILYVLDILDYSKVHTYMMLSSSYAEWVALSEIVKEVTL